MFTLAVVFISLCLTIFQANAQACDAKNLCPESAPCCSQYGYCGTGPEFCLGGCNPFMSNTLTSCQPNAVCKSQTYTWTDSSRILTDESQFDGSPDTYDWIVDGGNFEVVDGTLGLILTETNSGTRLSSTRYIQYGTITATLKTGEWNGVVLGFITMSNIRDEIDWEFPGDQTSEAQTNFFWQGQNTHGAVSGGLTNTYDNYHDYTIKWTAESLIFQIDGATVRTLLASDYPGQFPATPSRIQLSLWAGGGAGEAPGTVSWAGGPINWSDPAYVAAGGKFEAYFKSISVACADTPTADQVSYIYGPGSTSSKQNIQLSTLSPVLGSSASSASTSASASASTDSATPSGSNLVLAASATGSATDSAAPSGTDSAAAIPTASSGSSSVSGATSTATSSSDSATPTGSDVSAVPSGTGSSEPASATASPIVVGPLSGSGTSGTVTSSSEPASATASPIVVEPIGGFNSTDTSSSAVSSASVSATSSSAAHKPTPINRRPNERTKGNGKRMVRAYVPRAAAPSPSASSVASSGFLPNSGGTGSSGVGNSTIPPSMLNGPSNSTSGSTNSSSGSTTIAPTTKGNAAQQAAILSPVWALGLAVIALTISV